MVQVEQPKQKANRRRTDGDDQGHGKRNGRTLIGLGHEHM
jgi:hypothetical protein